MNDDFLALSLDRSGTLPEGPPAAAAEDPALPLILVADDHPTHLLYMRRLLESKGYACVTTDAPATAVRIALEKRPAVVLCDINFGIGKSSGLEVFTEIRRQYADVPFVVISAFVQEEMKERAAALGIASYLTKPVEPAELLTLLRTLTGPRTAP